jgi:pentapeptide MXKDX repeat protein
MACISRVSILVSAAIISLGLASASVAVAQDKMGKEDVTKDGRDGMAKQGDSMKKDDAMSKDGMKKDDAMSKDSMKKDDMKKDETKK